MVGGVGWMDGWIEMVGGYIVRCVDGWMTDAVYFGFYFAGRGGSGASSPGLDAAE